MYIKAKPSWQIIDGKMIYVDSVMEATIIRRLVKDGFSKKWRRTFSGVAVGSSHYRPDAELSILHDNMNRRAIVEFKPRSEKEFRLDRRKAMLDSSKYYKDALCMLYIETGRKWYFIEPGGTLQPTTQPLPGGVPIIKLGQPKVAIPVVLLYGQIYRSRPLAAIGTITAHTLEFGVNTIFGKAKRRR